MSCIDKIFFEGGIAQRKVRIGCERMPSELQDFIWKN